MIPLDTFILTNRGLLFANDLMIGDIIPHSNFNKNRKVISISEVRDCSGIRIYVDDYIDFTISKDHKQIVYFDAKINIVNPSELRIGHYLISPINSNDIPKNIINIPISKEWQEMGFSKEIDPDLAFIFGLFLIFGIFLDKSARKNVFRKNLVSYRFMNFELAHYTMDLFKKYFKDVIAVSKYIYIQDDNIQDFFRDMIGDYDVPYWIMRSNREVIQKFLSAFLIVIAVSTKNIIISFPTRFNEIFIKKVSMLFKYLGIENRFKQTISGYKLTISSEFAKTLHDNIFIPELRKRRGVERIINKNIIEFSREIIPFSLAKLINKKIEMAFTQEELNNNIYYIRTKECISQRKYYRGLTISLMESLKLYNWEEYKMIKYNNFFRIKKMEPVEFEGVDVRVDGDGIYQANGYWTCS